MAYLKFDYINQQPLLLNFVLSSFFSTAVEIRFTSTIKENTHVHVDHFVDN